MTGMKSFFNRYILKYTQREFLPTWISLFPVFFYISYLAIKAKSPLFFSATNPGIPLWGLTGDSKTPVLKQLPKEFIPHTLYISAGTSVTEIIKHIEFANMEYPLIIKPDIWEGGIGVEKLDNDADLIKYIHNYDEDVLIQEYIEWTNELTLLYYRFPHKSNWHISFISTKEFLAVTGDGESTLEELVRSGKRTKLFEHIFKREHADERNTIIPAWEEYLLQFKWNNHHGTAFVNSNHLITPDVQMIFDHIADEIEGFYYGRFDIKYQDINEFIQGKSFKILDVNWVWAGLHQGTGRDYPIWRVRSIWFNHWNIIYKIAKINHDNWVPYTTIKEFRAIIKNFKEKIGKFK